MLFLPLFSMLLISGAGAKEVEIVTYPPAVSIYSASGKALGDTSQKIVTEENHGELVYYLGDNEASRENGDSSTGQYLNTILKIPPLYFQSHDMYPEKGVYYLVPREPGKRMLQGFR